MALTEKYVSSAAGGSGDGLSAGSPFTWAQMLAEINGGTGAGKRYNVKADGTYTRSTDDSMWSAVGGTTTSPICIRGYKTTIGDGYLGRDSAGALITTNMPQLTFTNGRIELAVQTVFESISMDYTSTGGSFDRLLVVNNNCSVIGCKISTARNSSDTKVAMLGGDFAVHFESDYFMTATSGPTGEMVYCNNGLVRVDSCRFICSATTVNAGIKGDDGNIFYGCLIKGAGAGAGIYFTGNKAVLVRNCTISNWQDGIYWNVASNDRQAWIAGNMLTDNSRYGINVGAGWIGIVGPNRVRDNVTGNTNTHDWFLAGRIIPFVTTDTGGASTDYTNVATNDYSLIQASPGKGVNIPKISDHGAYGLPDPSGGGTAVFNPLAKTIIRPA